MAKLSIIAAKFNGDEMDKQDAMLAGLDDGWDGIRKAIIKIAGEDGEWAGYPMPTEHATITVEPRHPLYKTLNGATLGEKPAEPPPSPFAVVNHWHDYDRGREVYVLRDGDGKSRAVTVPTHQATRRARMAMDTLGASQAWSVEAEFTAMARLKTLVTPSAFRYYLLTGTFLETSKRSGVIYLFRKCRPTLAFKGTCDGDDTKLLCSLCMHPIGYYDGTFAGSMVPSDDIIAALLFMRADERKFWGKCNQHPCRAAEAGV